MTVKTGRELDDGSDSEDRAMAVTVKTGRW